MRQQQFDKEKKQLANQLMEAIRQVYENNQYIDSRLEDILSDSIGALQQKRAPQSVAYNLYHSLLDLGIEEQAYSLVDFPFEVEAIYKLIQPLVEKYEIMANYIHSTD